MLHQYARWTAIALGLIFMLLVAGLSLLLN